MSLTSLAIRTCAFLALYKSTIAEDRVFESVLAPIDETAKDIPQPFITLAVDESRARGEQVGTDLLASTDSISLVIELAIQAPVEIEGQDGETVTEVTLPETETALEWALDLLSHEVIRRLTIDPTWGDLFRSFVLAYHNVVRVRGGMAEKVRLAARQIVLEIKPISDPDSSALAASDLPWPRFLAALRAIPVPPTSGADPNLAAYPALADSLERAIRDTGFEPWEVAAARLGVTRADAGGLGFGPHPLLAQNTIPLTDEVDLSGDLSATITEETADQAGEI